MGIRYNPWDDEITHSRTYTFNEAIEHMKMLDRYPTNRTINWVDSKTGKPVIIGYTGG